MKFNFVQIFIACFVICISCAICDDAYSANFSKLAKEIGKGIGNVYSKERVGIHMAADRYLKHKKKEEEKEKHKHTNIEEIKRKYLNKN